MSLQTQIHSLVIRVADEFKTVYSKIGNLSSLSTTDKSTLVAAINELKAAIAAVAVIDAHWAQRHVVAEIDGIAIGVDALQQAAVQREDIAPTV